MAKQTRAEEIAELEALIAGMGDGTEPPPAASTVEPIAIPHPLDGEPYPTCDECGVQIRRDFKYYGRYEGRLCGSACAEDALLSARELLGTAHAAASFALELSALPMWKLLPEAIKDPLVLWAHTLDIPESLKINEAKALKTKEMLDKVEAHEAEITARRKKRIP